MAAITVASPRILSLPQVGSTGILGAGIGFNSQVSTGTIPSTNTDTTAILGIVDLQLSAFGSANAGGPNGVGSRWTPKHLTITVTNTSGQTLTGIALSASNVDAPDAPGTADYTYGQASEFPSGGLASRDSVTVTYTILGVIKRYLWLTGTWATAPVTGALALDVDLSGEGAASSVISGGNLTYDDQVTINTSAAALPNQAIRRAILTADPSNATSSYVYIGDAAAQHTPLAPGQSMSVQVSNLGLLYAKGSTNGLLLDIYGEE